MKKTIYIHIGTEKTGTKAIQNFCCKNNDFLKENNLYYPYNTDKQYMFNITHWPLAAALTKNNKFVPEDKMLPAQEIYDIFKEDIDKVPYDNILISGEPFSVNVTNKRSILNLKNQLANYNVKIIVYLRRQDNYYVSLTSTKIKGGVHNEDTKFSIDEVFLNKERYDYYNLVKKWTDVFGENNIIVKVFERKIFKNENIIDDFFEIFNIDVSKHRSNSSEDNISLSLDSLYFMNIINGKFELNDKERRKIYSLLEKRKSNYKINNLISPKERYEIIKHYESTNSKVGKMFLGREDGILFNEPIPRLNDEWDEFKGLTSEMVFEICDYLFRSKYGQESEKKLMNTLVKGAVNEILNNTGNLRKNIDEDYKKISSFYSLEKKILKKGNLISWFQKKETGWHFMSTGKDPYFLIPDFNNDNNFNALLVQIKITVPKDTILQLFYKSSDTHFNENQSIKEKVKKGYNHLFLRLQSENSIKALRFDAGNVNGEYILHEFEVSGKKK